MLPADLRGQVGNHFRVDRRPGLVHQLAGVVHALGNQDRPIQVRAGLPYAGAGHPKRDPDFFPKAVLLLSVLVEPVPTQGDTLRHRAQKLRGVLAVQQKGHLSQVEVTSLIQGPGRQDLHFLGKVVRLHQAGVLDEHMTSHLTGAGAEVFSLDPALPIVP